jgi:Mrp family chromosome partitioning ATPase
MTLKIAVIGNKDYYDFLSGELPDWDWQEPSATVDDFWDNLTEKGVIDQDTPMIIIDPDLYDSTGEDQSFEDIIAQMSPHALVSVIAFNDVDDTTPKDDIQASVSSYAQTDSEFAAKFYWIDADDIIQSIHSTIEDYVNAGDSDKDATSIFIRELNLAPPEEPVDESLLDKKQQRADRNKGEEYSEDESYDTYTNALGRKGLNIAVTSAKGGSGKSTIAYTLAQEIGKSTRMSAEQGLIPKPLEVCLVDMDVYDGQLGFVIGASHPTMLSIAREPHIDQKSVRKNLITNDIIERTKGQEGNYIEFSALLAPKSPLYVEDTPADMWRRVINVLDTMFDVVIFDTSVMYFLDEIIYDVAYPMADKIIYVTDLDIKSILDTTKWLKIVCSPSSASGYGIGIEKIGVVINKGMNEVGMGPKRITKILEIATKEIYQNIDSTMVVDDLVPHVLTTVSSYPRLITGATNSQNLGAIIDVPTIERAFRRLAQAILPLDIAKNLTDVSDPARR